VSAEAEGKLPLTRAIGPLARVLGITRGQARDLLLEAGPSEWHHVGKYAARCNYYDVNALIRLHAAPDALHAVAITEDLERAEAAARSTERTPRVYEPEGRRSSAWEEVKRLADEAGMSHSACRRMLGL
jgi:hypothetical protein